MFIDNISPELYNEIQLYIQENYKDKKGESLLILVKKIYSYFEITPQSHRGKNLNQLQKGALKECLGCVYHHSGLFTTKIVRILEKDPALSVTEKLFDPRSGTFKNTLKGVIYNNSTGINEALGKFS